jgi:small subunit ribosomal protein S16
MVKIRLSRTGKKNYSSYRIVVIHDREKRDSKVIETLGHYDPHLKENKYKIDAERAKYWLGVGAQPTETVQRFLVKEGLVAKPAFTKKYASKPGKKATERAAKKAE